MNTAKLCKYGCGKELSWDTVAKTFKEQDGTPHTKDRCESLKAPKPATTDPLTELTAAIRELAAAIRAGRTGA